jgi:hypothetical protein
MRRDLSVNSKAQAAANGSHLAGGEPATPWLAPSTRLVAGRSHGLPNGFLAPILVRLGMRGEPA